MAARGTFALVGMAAFACILQACSGKATTEDATPAPDAGAPVAPTPPRTTPAVDAGGEDNGAPSSVYPAPHAAPRQLVKLAGPVLPHPTVIPVFFGDDADRTRTEALLAALPGSDYWKLLSEYGVNDITIGASVVIADVAPATFSLESIDSKVSALWTRADSPAPAPDGTQIYALFFPTQTQLLQADGSPFCDVGGAYHDSKGTQFAYAITPHCSGSFDEFALSATHELIEASTDPYPLVNPAWAGADPAHIADRGEIGDLCDYGGQIGAGGGVPMFGTTVERVFSNKSALAGHDPCVPDLGVPYFGAAPVVKDDLSYDDAILGSLPAKGVRVKVGETKTITLELFSDRKTSAFSVSVRTSSPLSFSESTSITASLDRRKGENGEKLHLTITRTASSDGGDVVHLLATSQKSMWSDSLFVGE